MCGLERATVMIKLILLSYAGVQPPFAIKFRRRHCSHNACPHPSIGVLNPMVLFTSRPRCIPPRTAQSYCNIPNHRTNDKPDGTNPGTNHEIRTTNHENNGTNHEINRTYYESCRTSNDIDGTNHKTHGTNAFVLVVFLNSAMFTPIGTLLSNN